MKKYEKTIANQIVGQFNNNFKIILYTPTWRPYEYKFPLDDLINLDYSRFNDWLKDNNFYFFYTSHSGSFTKRIKKNFERIIYIDHEKYPMFDINEFMNEVDILLNDYTTTSTDFALLNRPQIFFMPDYDFYYQEKGFIEDYRSSIPGDEIFTFDDFINLLSLIDKDPERYLKKFELAIFKLLEKYYDPELKNSNKNLQKFILQLLR